MNKSITIISPITLIVVIILDIAVIGYGIFAVMKLVESLSAGAIFFAAIEVVALIVGILTTREALTNRAIFRDDEVEFTGIDGLNVFNYDEIENIEVYKDNTASLSKNFVDRHALLILNFTDETSSTVDIGLTTKGTLNKLTSEFSNHVDETKITYLSANPKKAAKNKSKDE